MRTLHYNLIRARSRGERQQDAAGVSLSINQQKKQHREKALMASIHAQESCVTWISGRWI